MIVRCAYFEGHVEASDSARFEALICEQIVPTIASYPRIRNLRVLWGREYELDERSIYLLIEHTYDSLDDLNCALASDVRRLMLPTLAAVQQLFDGRIYHVNYEVDERFER